MTKSLNEIFKEADTVEAGPFKLIKKIYDGWKDSCFLVNDREVILTAQQKQFMAALICLPDQQLSIENFKIAFGINDPTWSTDDIWNNIKVQIFNIRNAIIEQTGDLAASQIITPLNPYRQGGQKGSYTGDHAYYLTGGLVPSIRQDFDAVRMDILKHGPFEMKKMAEQKWKSGRFFIEGYEIPLEERALQIMTMMIAKPDHILTREEFAQGLELSNFISADPNEYLRQIIWRIKTAITETAGESFANQIEYIQEGARARAITGQPGGAYRLSLPEAGVA